MSGQFSEPSFKEALVDIQSPSAESRTWEYVQGSRIQGMEEEDGDI